MRQSLFVYAIVAALAVADVHAESSGIENGPAATDASPVQPTLKELIDPKASEQVLELIVKIAQHPTTWKQIHRVLETLEANNAAYSQRIDVPVAHSELGWMSKRVDQPGDKRNDVPDNVAQLESNTAAPIVTAPSIVQPLEMTFQRWKDELFTSSDFVEPIHPQVKAAAEPEQIFQPLEVQPSSPLYGTEKNFEERLRDIERELKKLSKLHRLVPLKLRHLAAVQHKQKRLKTKEAIQARNQTVEMKQKHPHPKFAYHRVHNASTEADNLAGPNFWKRVASLKRNGGGGDSQSTKRNTFVAVSISAPAGQAKHADESDGESKPTEPVRPTVNSAKKENHAPRRRDRQGSDVDIPIL